MRLPPWLWRICRSKWTKRFLIASPFLLMISVVAFYVMANWWGRQCLEREVAAMRADGLPVTLEELFGPRPPAEEDVFQHPAMLVELGKSSGAGLDNLTNMWISGLKKNRDWEPKPDLGKLGDVRLLTDPPQAARDEAEVARDILAMIGTQSGEFEACVEGMRRPVFHWGSNWDESSARSAQLLRLQRFVADRARLHLAAGCPDLAAADVETALHIRGGLRTASGFFVFICLAAGERTTGETIWEGIRRQAWSERQLAQFQPKLEEVQLWRTLREAVPGDWVYLKYALEMQPGGYGWERSWQIIGSDFFDAGKRGDVVGMQHLGVEGWDKVKPPGLKMREPVQDMGCMREWYVGFRDSNRVPEFSDFDDWNFFKGSERKTFSRTIRDVQTRRSLLLCGIALERYRLKHGAVPAKLESLVPEFLAEVPKDISDGQPLRYQVLPDGAPHVWSIWPSGKDEGGMPNRDRTKNTVWTTGQIPGLTEKSYNGR
jgi:hypothetical protein